MLVANLLTASRIPLALVFWAVATDPWWALAVLVAAAATDAVDGTVARRARRRGASARSAQVGAWLDPMCDKFFAASVLLAAYVLLDAPALLLIVVGLREVIIVPAVIVYRLSPRLRRVRWDFTASRLGKVATAAQFLAIGGVVLDHAWQVPLAAASAGIGLAAAYQYLAEATRLAVQATPVAARAAGRA